MIGIVAGPAVGKTTMIGTIYELIHRARLDGFGFAGSETLRGYEERTFLSRMKSNLHKPDTPRTKTTETLSFTHLRLFRDGGIMDVYFSDRSGEHFDNALARPADFAGFTELLRSHAIIMMVDLEQLLTAPQPLMSWVRRGFMAMEEHNLLCSKPLILVGTKADLLFAEGRAEAEARLATLRDDLIGRSTSGVQLTSTVVASRASKGSNKPGEGLESLLEQVLPKPQTRPFQLGESS
jgi:Double-GTPase 2